ncbi:alpha/beta fold hydrolase [Streptomyces tirandamycinicus]|uniref:thioesterase II family protein n=1 Tax=Streptomyces tirandamycinicus TaxID=2174846 RepID=UPI000364EECC
MGLHGGHDAEQWFRRQAAQQPHVRLVCFPHAGGAASAYREWGRLLPPGVDLLAVQYPGRQNRMREPCVEDMAELADRIAAALVPYLGLPLAFFGHSMGSSVAYEVALRLEQRSGLVLERLFVSGRTAPHRVPAEPPGPQDDRELLASVRRLGEPDAGAYDDPDLLPLVLPSLRADHRLLGAYRRERPVPLSAPVTAFGGEQDPVCPVAELAGWADLTTADLRQRTFPGGHFYLVEHRVELVRLVGAELAGSLHGR